MKLVRRLHLYLGCFFAPMLLFYVATGWYQSVNTNRGKTLGEAGNWVSKLTSIHVDLVYPSETAEVFATGGYKFLVIAMCVAMILTVVLGLYLAFRTLRPKWMLWVTLALGILIPILTLRLGLKQ